MSVGFRAVQWNRAKRVYDGILLAAVALFLALFTALHWRWHPPKDNLEAIDIGIRAFGTCAFVMLTAILWIGPLARLDRRFRPLLYNRRHFGVLTFLVALVHVALLLSWYLAQGNLASLGAELTKWPDYAKFIGFPFKTLGIAALLILFLMAATSHDFWLAFLSLLIAPHPTLHGLVFDAKSIVCALMVHFRGPDNSGQQVSGRITAALKILAFSRKKAARMMHKVLESAIANAEHNHGADIDELKVTTIQVDKGQSMKRFSARAKGRGNRIEKQTCHIVVKVGA